MESVETVVCVTLASIRRRRGPQHIPALHTSLLVVDMVEVEVVFTVVLDIDVVFAMVGLDDVVLEDVDVVDVDVEAPGEIAKQVQALDSLLGVHSAGTNVGVVLVAPLV